METATPKKATVLTGMLLGEHGFKIESINEEIEEKLIKTNANFTILNTSREKWEEYESYQAYIDMAKLLADNKIYFYYDRMAQRPHPDRPTGLDKETIKAIREVAGEYFLGDGIGEPGLAFSAKGEHFFGEKYSPNFEFDNVKDAHDKYVSIVNKFVVANESMGMPTTSTSIESTMLTKYNIEAGIWHQMLEAPNADPDMLYPSVRGAVRNLDGDKKWDVLIAHEWYGGMRHDDTLKAKRLDLLTKFSYMQGAYGIMFESGDDQISSYGQKFDADFELCKAFREAIKNTHDMAKNGIRPEGFPKVKVGFISGLYDGFAAFCNSSVWAQYGRREWGHGEAEYSYRILDSIVNKRRWGDVANYGDHDTSAFPAYGTYDIVPIEADVNKLSDYEYLIMLGWNTMTDENMNKLTEYVRRGGKLLLSAAHLNYSTKREGEYIPPSNEKLEALCGCRYNGVDITTNCGTKFEYETLNPELLYPASENLRCDPLYSAGYTDYMETELVNARRLGFACDTWHKAETIVNTVLENRVGKGTVTFITSKNYPGHPALTPLYSMFVREMVSSSARNCDIKVIASDKLRYTVYEGNLMYLLNTDYDLPITVKIIFEGKEQLITLNSLEMKSIQL